MKSLNKHTSKKREEKERKTGGEETIGNRSRDLVPWLSLTEAVEEEWRKRKGKNVNGNKEGPRNVRNRGSKDLPKKSP